MKFLVLQHINIEHPGIFLKFMKEDNISIDTIELDENEKIPNLDKYDAMVVMGGPMDTWQEKTYPWLKIEKENIHNFVSVKKKPYLGLCLGAQLLSEAIGGEVKKMEKPEIGVLNISINSDKTIFSGLDKNLKVLQWHSYEVCNLPSNAKILASSPACNVQAFSTEKAFGLQFHVEQTNETVPQWACVPEYKLALENTLGKNALEKFKNDVEKNLSIFNTSAKTIYKNFKKII
jgi:GMP synthase-like glutamine amidotransferase|tara:strand:+ start:220 stop:918 length:699 start_codon:yes stop_codon:yes gene_type:complete